MTVIRAIILSVAVGIGLPAIFIAVILLHEPHPSASSPPSTSTQPVAKSIAPDFGITDDPWPDDLFERSYRTDADTSDQRNDGGSAPSQSPPCDDHEDDWEHAPEPAGSNELRTVRRREDREIDL